jgi:uncharacterized membrane protein
MPDPTDTVESLAPIQLLVVVFPGNRFRGTILPELDRLKRKRIIRMIDMLLVRKDGEGNVVVATGSDLDFEEATALGAYVGSLAGFAAAGSDGMERGALEGAAQLADGHVFDEEDVFRVTRSLDNETTAALLLVEHTWAKPLLDAVQEADGVQLMNEWVAHSALLAVGPPAPADAEPSPDA